jgi:hypothetical protein
MRPLKAIPEEPEQPSVALQQDEDIDLLIKVIREAEECANNPQIPPKDLLEGLKNFIEGCATPLCALLEELRTFRQQTGEKGSGEEDYSKGTHRVLIEGYSDESAEKALSSALEKASRYFSEQHDVNITLQQLTKLPKGGHRATLEIYVTPLTLKDTAHIQGNDVALKRLKTRDFVLKRKLEREHMRHLVYDHFAAITGGAQRHIPDYFLINVTDASLMNMMMENDFFAAGHPKLSAPKASSQPSPPNQFWVRVRPPAPEDQ